MATKYSKQSGFSLIEILLVLGFASALISMGVVNLKSYMQELRLNQATTAFVGSLRQMEDDALRFSQKISLSESDLSIGRVVWKTDNGDFGQLDLPHGAVISAVNKSIPSAPIWFSGRGLPFQQATFELELNDNTREVVLLATGVVFRK